MSHEIRTPLNAVLGIGQLLAETTQLTLEQQQYINMISNSGHLLLTIINDVSFTNSVRAVLDLSAADLRNPPLFVSRSSI